MCPGVLIQVILAPKLFAASRAGMRPVARVYELVSRQLFVPREGLATIMEIALERPFARVDAHMISQLAIVREGHRTDGALEVFGSALLPRRPLPLLLCGSSHDGINGEVGHFALQFVVLVLVRRRTCRVHGCVLCVCACVCVSKLRGETQTCVSVTF